MKRPYWERVVTADGCGPVLFFLITTVAIVLLSYYLHFWLAFAARVHPMTGLRVE